MYLYHSQDIKAAVPIADVLAMYGMRNDANRMIPCPDINHSDTHPSAKIYPQSNTCHCFACNANLNPIDIVMQQEGVNFPQACEILIDRFGLDVEWYADRVSDKPGNEKKEVFPVSPRELKLLGLAMTVDLKEPYMDKQGHMQLKHTPYSMTALWKEDPEGFEYMIAGKVQEVMENKLYVSEYLLDFAAQYPFDGDAKFEEDEELCHHGEELYKAYMEKGTKPPRFSKDLELLFEYTGYQNILNDYYRVEAELKTLENLSERFPKTLLMEEIQIAPEMEEVER